MCAFPFAQAISLEKLFKPKRHHPNCLSDCSRGANSPGIAACAISFKSAAGAHLHPGSRSFLLRVDRHHHRVIARVGIGSVERDISSGLDGSGLDHIHIHGDVELLYRFGSVLAIAIQVDSGAGDRAASRAGRRSCA